MKTQDSLVISKYSRLGFIGCESEKYEVKISSLTINEVKFITKKDISTDILIFETEIKTIPISAKIQVTSKELIEGDMHLITASIISMTQLDTCILTKSLG